MGVLMSFTSTQGFAADGSSLPLRISPLTIPAPPADAVPMRWVGEGDASWLADEPTFALADPQSTFACNGWIAMSNRCLMMQFIVHEEVLINQQTGGDIWNGCCVQLGIDARGDGSGALSPETPGLQGPDDMGLTMALAKDGPHGWKGFVYPGKQDGLLPLNYSNITRDDVAKTTTYHLELPWSELETMPGVFPSIGVAVHVAHIDSPGGLVSHLRWSAGAESMPRPGIFHKLVVDLPPGKLFSASTTRNELWETGDSVDMVIAVCSASPQTLNVKMGKLRASYQIPGDQHLHRLLLQALPTANSGDTLLATVTKQGSRKTHLMESVKLVVVGDVYQQLYERLDDLLLTSPHPLFSRHLRSVKSLIAAEWARASLYCANNPRAAHETLGYFQEILNGFHHDAADWLTYLEGRRCLLMAYLSPRDGTVEYYQLSLPRQWDAALAYPLLVELHGAGNPHSLSGPATQLGMGNKPADLHGYTAGMSYGQKVGAGYTILPYGRGNSGYRDIGETDIWEAIADVSKAFSIDANRRYLYGFSMGGGGTWALGMRTPDYWAGLAILSGGGGAQRDAATEIARNVSCLPVWLWSGEDDRALAGVQFMRTEIEKYGGHPIFSSSPGIGHNYLDDKQVEFVTWLLQQTRKRPDQFTYVCDRDEHRGCWGITMQRNPEVSGVPRFTCAIAGNSVTIESTGTKGLNVELGENGLGLSGEVTVIWNGMEAYTGEPTQVRLGDGAGSGRVRF